MANQLKTQNSDYRLFPDGRFVIQNYHLKKPFSNFLPGIAGLYGTPMWVFYVNRGQGVASFGTRDKDHAILEFFPANKAYQNVTTLGFRTFIKFLKKGVSGAAADFYEPFREILPEKNGTTERSMEISSHEFLVTEIRKAHGLQVSALYFTVPGEPLAVLARELMLTNISEREMDLEVLDGLPMVNPYGMNEFFIKNMSRTIEAWMTAENVPKKAPFLRLKVDATDRPEVTAIEEGNFYFGMMEPARSRAKLLDPIVDPAEIFGSTLDFSAPSAFLERTPFAYPLGQLTENKTPCAFSFARLRLPPGASRKIHSCFGQAGSVELLNRTASRAVAPGYFEEKRLENKRLIDGIKSRVFTVTSQSSYDLYCGQTYLDNVLRGGMPVAMPDHGKESVFYVYSRKHGDLERDYNQFLLEPTYFAQGDGNYRDMNQNRRSDVWFDPRVKDANVKTFLNLTQLDGFNPLVVKGMRFHFHRSARSREALRRHLGPKGADLCQEAMRGSFGIGELYRFLEERRLMTPAGFMKFLGDLSVFLSGEQKAEHGEGFWTDHWTYNLDLIENYLAIYPDQARAFLFEKKEYTFYDNDRCVRPRRERFVLKGPGVVRQYGSVIKDGDKSRLLEAREKDAGLVRTRHGRGEIYRTVLFVKLLCLFTNKFASLDAQGVGVEMEADKPSWLDALNGLPGLLGSSLPETFELKRLAVFLLQFPEDLGMDFSQKVALPAELARFVEVLNARLDTHFKDKGPRRNFVFWDQASSAKEEFRAVTRHGLSGHEKKMPLGFIRSFLEHAREKIDIGIERAFDARRGIFPTYFENEVTRWRMSKGRVEPLEFRQKMLPLFLEGPVHALKVEKDPQRKKTLLKAVRSSGLYDAGLAMYKLNAPMGEAPLEIGRARIFAPGWLENESVWLHMEYKWLLEILKSGMDEEFFEDFRKALIPFQPAERYGRSILENSSFIVSSTFSDKSLHGAGFVARLSGSTAEFLSMWLVMNAGKRPFILGPDKKLLLRFEPHLPAFLFLQREAVRVFMDRNGDERKLTLPKNTLAFLFLGKTLVVYHNPKRLDTFGKMRVSVKRITWKDARAAVTEFKGDTVPAPYAAKVRDGFVPRIDIELG